MGNAAKEKGTRLEKKVSVMLTNLFDKPFQRTAGSGSFTGGKNKQRIEGMDSTAVKAFRGDIIAPTGFNWVVECKNYTNLSAGFHGIMKGESRHLEGFLNEVRYDADTDEGELPYTLFVNITKTDTGSSAGTWICLPEKHFNLVSHLAEKQVPFTLYPHPINEDYTEYESIVIVHKTYLEYLKEHILKGVSA